MPASRKTLSFPRVFFLLIPIITIIAVITVAALIFRSAKTVEPKAVSNLFVNEHAADKKEPSFSLKLPDGWYRDLGVKGKERLLSFSPDRDNKGITYRAVISAGVAPTPLDLAGETARARKDIGALAVDHKFIVDKSIAVKGYPAHLLEYNTVLDNDSQNVEKTLGKSGLLIHHSDIITVKDGYFIDIAAYTYEWAWPEFVGVIEKSFNTISYSPT